MAFLGLLLSFAMIGIWLYSLVHCIKHRHDKDRMLWVLITLLGGPIGAILYLTMGRPKAEALPPLVYSGSTAVPPIIYSHTGVQDEKERVREIERALWGSTKKQ